MDLKPFSYLKDIPECDLMHIGASHFNEKDPTNPILECLFQLPSWDLVSVGITAGFLPYIWPGQIFRYGEKFKNARKVRNLIETRSFSIDTENVQETVMSGFHFYHIPSSFKYFELIPVKLIPIDRYNLILPETELLRFYYVKSDKLALSIFNGHFSPDSISKFVINDKYETPRLIDNKFRFMYRHGFSRSDALIIGRILASEEAMSSVRRVHNSVVMEHINSGSHHSAFFRTGFPFSGKTTLWVTGYSIPNSNKFFVNRILSCSGPFPFSALSYCDEIQAGNPNPDGEKIRLPRQGNSNNSEKKGESTSTYGSDSLVKSLTLKMMTSEQTGAQEVVIKSEKFSESSYTFDKQGVPIPPIIDPVDVSTGNPKNNGRGKGKQRIIDELIPAPSDEMVNIVNAVRNLTLKDSFVKNVESICLNDGSFNSKIGAYLFPFPKVECDYKNKTRIFSFLNSNRDDSSSLTKRLVVCFRIEFASQNGNKNAYLFAAEKRKVKETSQLPIVLLYHKSLPEISNLDLTRFILDTVKNKVWQKCDEHSKFETKYLQHDEIELMTNNLLSMIKSIS
jgi:hypothetical protein